MQSGKAITLKYLYDHIEDSVLIFSCEKCSVYLVADEKQYADSLVKLEFKGVQCVRSVRTDCSPVVGIYPKEFGVSYIVELTESKWPVEAHQLYVYADASIEPRGRHFVVSNHDIFHEILAESFTETIIQPDDNEYDVVKSQLS